MNIDDLTKMITPERRMIAEREIERILNDVDVVEFLRRYDLIHDNEFINRNRSRLMEYVKVRDTDAVYLPEMALHSNNICIIYKFRNETAALKYKNGESAYSRAIYDDSTRPFTDAELNPKNITSYDMEIIQQIKMFVENYKYGHKSTGFWLVGRMGCGKTHLMGYMTKGLVKKGISVRFINVGEMIANLKNRMRQNGSNLEQIINSVKNSEVLILDDIGTEKITEWVIKEVLYPILNHRMNHGKPTFFTSNLTKSQYLQQVSNAEGLNNIDVQRLSERLNTLVKEIQMMGNNRREHVKNVV